MTIEECYTLIDGDFKGACSRLLSSERVTKYAIRFLSNPDYDNLKNEMTNKEWEKAFLSVHTLKGLSLSLGFTKYGEISSLLTEELRGGVKSEQKAVNYFEQLSQEQTKLVKVLSQYSA